MTADNAIILVIEDEWSSRRFLTEALSDIAKVRCVASASEAYTVLSESSDDVAVVITDIIMRGQSGLDFLSYLRNDLGRRDLPVIVHSAHGGPEMERMAFENGATEFLTKPVLLPELRQRVSALFELTQALTRQASLESRRYQVIDSELFRQVLREEVGRAIVGGYALLLCRAHCDGFLRAGVRTKKPREVVLEELAQQHHEHFPNSYTHVFQDLSLSFGLVTMSQNVDTALRLSRLYRAWLSERALFESVSEQADHLGLGMLVYDFSVLDAQEREAIDINTMTGEMLAKVEKASRDAGEAASVLVTVVQDVVTV
jgi:CheY-like chemotaxis protein